MEVAQTLPLLPGDPRLIDYIVCELKNQGIFDQFRKECIADVDTKPAYQNLRQRVEVTVDGFLSRQNWKPDLNKNQLREKLRKHILDSNFLEQGVERIVDQVVNPKIASVFLPQVEEVVYKCLGLEKPDKSSKQRSDYFASSSQPLHVDTDALLPHDLEAVSPDSVKSHEKSSENPLILSESNDVEMKLIENKNNTEIKMDASAPSVDTSYDSDDSKDDDFESPAFEPIDDLKQESPNISQHSINSENNSRDSNDWRSSNVESKAMKSIHSQESSDSVEDKSYNKTSIVYDSGEDANMTSPEKMHIRDSSTHFKLTNEDNSSDARQCFEPLSSKKQGILMEYSNSGEDVFPKSELKSKASTASEVVSSVESKTSSESNKINVAMDVSVDSNDSKSSGMFVSSQKETYLTKDTYTFANKISSFSEKSMDETSDSNELKIDIQESLESEENLKNISSLSISGIEGIKSPSVETSVAKTETPKREDTEYHKSSRDHDRHKSSSSRSKDRKDESKHHSRSSHSKHSSRHDDARHSSSHDSSRKSSKDRYKSDEKDYKDKSSSSHRSSSSSHRHSSHRSSSGSHRHSTSERSSDKYDRSSSKNDSKDTYKSEKSKDPRRSSRESSRDKSSSYTGERNSDYSSHDRYKHSHSSHSSKDKYTSSSSKHGSSDRHRKDKKDDKKNKERPDKDEQCSTFKSNRTRRSTDRDSNDGNDNSTKHSSTPASHQASSKEKSSSKSKGGGGNHSNGSSSSGQSDSVEVVDKVKVTSGGYIKSEFNMFQPVVKKSPTVPQLHRPAENVVPSAMPTPAPSSTAETNTSPVNKKPVIHIDSQLNPSKEEVVSEISPTPISEKVKKPRIASNIFEARKLMKVRKNIDMLERKNNELARKELEKSKNISKNESKVYSGSSGPELQITCRKRSVSNPLSPKYGQTLDDSNKESFLYFDEESKVKAKSMLFRSKKYLKQYLAANNGIVNNTESVIFLLNADKTVETAFSQLSSKRRMIKPMNMQKKQFKAFPLKVHMSVDAEVSLPSSSHCYVELNDLKYDENYDEVFNVKCLPLKKRKMSEPKLFKSVDIKPDKQIEIKEIKVQDNKITENSMLRNEDYFNGSTDHDEFGEYEYLDYYSKVDDTLGKTSKQDIMEIILGGGISFDATLVDLNHLKSLNSSLQTKSGESNGKTVNNKKRRISFKGSDDIIEPRIVYNNNLKEKSECSPAKRRNVSSSTDSIIRNKIQHAPQSPDSDKSVENHLNSNENIFISRPSKNYKENSDDISSTALNQINHQIKNRGRTFRNKTVPGKCVTGNVLDTNMIQTEKA